MTDDPFNNNLYWSAIWQKEGLNTWRTNEWTNNEVLKDIDLRHGKQDEIFVLELGCGNGVLAEKICKAFPQVRYDGIDISEVAINQARDRCTQFGPFALFSVRDMTEWSSSYHDGFYDVVIANEFLEHFPEKQCAAIMREMRRLAKTVIITVPNNTLGPKEHAEHHQIFDEDSLAAAIDKNLPANRPAFNTLRIRPHEDIMCKGEVCTSVLYAVASDIVLEKPNVLIAAPIASHKEYALEHYFKWIREQQWSKYGIAFCANGPKKRETQSNLDGKEIGKAKIRCLLLEDDEYDTRIMKLHRAREELRKYAIVNGYDAILWLDTDTVPQSKDTIERLWRHNKEAVSGLYFYKQQRTPVAMHPSGVRNYNMNELTHAVMSNTLLTSAGVGFGCFFVKGEALKQPFDYYHTKEETSEDFSWCDQYKGTIYFDPVVLCMHYGTDIKQGMGFTVEQRK